jgi:uncharacterized membrane protein
MNCPWCDHPIEEDVHRCTRCGSDFGREMSERISLCFSLRAQLHELERFVGMDLERLAATHEAPSASPAPSTPSEPLISVPPWVMSDPAPPRPAEEPQEIPEPAPPPPRTASQPRRPEPEPALLRKQTKIDLEFNFGQKWVLIAGLLTMVVGVGYFLKYSFDQGWIGPAGRVAIAYAWGIGFLAAGDRLRKEYERFGLSLVGGGIAVLYFAAYAAFDFYHLFGQLPSFAVMSLVTATAGALAVRYDERRIAVLGIIGGFLTPILLGTGQANLVGLMGYLSVLNLGILFVSFHKQWEILNALGFVFTWLLYAAWFQAHYRPDEFRPAILFANLFYLVHTVAPFAYQFTGERKGNTTGLGQMVPNSLVSFAFCYRMITLSYPIAWVGLLTTGYAAVFLALATYLARTDRDDAEAFVLLLAKAGMFLVVTIPLIFSGHWITVFWAAQAIALLAVGIGLERKLPVIAGYALLLVAAGKFVVYDYAFVFGVNLAPHMAAGAWSASLVERLVTTAAVLVAVHAAGTMADRAWLRNTPLEYADSVLIRAAEGVLLFIVLNVETATFFAEHLPDAGFAAISALWTLFAVALMAIGFRRNSQLLRKTAIGLFVLTLGKVFRFDMVRVSTPYRIVSFVLLGIVLVGTSYLYHRYRDRLSPPNSEDGAPHED